MRYAGVVQHGYGTLAIGRGETLGEALSDAMREASLNDEIGSVDRDYPRGVIGKISLVEISEALFTEVNVNGGGFAPVYLRGRIYGIASEA